jgi:cytochrome P450
MALITLWILFAAAAYVIVQLATAIFAPKRPPPGLRHVPVAGTASQLGPYPQQKLRQWALEHGELFKVPLGTEQWIYVNSPAAVKEIFDKQSQHSSSRAPSPVVLDLVSGGMRYGRNPKYCSAIAISMPSNLESHRFLLMPYSPYWRKLRAIVHKLLTPKSSDTFMPSQEFEAKQLLWDILTDNENQQNFYMHIRRYTTSG